MMDWRFMFSWAFGWQADKFITLVGTFQALKRCHHHTPSPHFPLQTSEALSIVSVHVHSPLPIIPPSYLLPSVYYAADPG